MEQIGIFDEAKRLERLSQLGDSLERLNKVIPWEMFRPQLEAVFNNPGKKATGRPPFDRILMFKILVLQRIYNLSDDQTEYQINDRITFMRFLSLGINSTVPDAKTIWKFKEDLKNAGVMDNIFNLFEAKLESDGIITHKGTIIDATFADAPRQHNHHDENKEIKAGKTPEEWEKPENEAKLRQKDTDARWTKKGNETHYGYKDHVKADADSKMITGYDVTSAEVHDSQRFGELLDEKDQVVYADSGYAGEGPEASVPEGIEKQVMERAHRNHPLTEEQKKANHQKSHIRVRIEHIFGYMTGHMHGITVRSIGLARARFNLALTNLVYNLCRYECIGRTQPQRG